MLATVGKDRESVNHCPKLTEDTSKVKMEHAYDPAIPLTWCRSKENEVSTLEGEVHALLTAALSTVWMNAQRYG